MRLRVSNAASLPGEEAAGTKGAGARARDAPVALPRAVGMTDDAGTAPSRGRCGRRARVYLLPKSVRLSRRSGAKSETRLTRASLPLRLCVVSRAVSSRINEVASTVSRCGTAGPPSTER